MHIRILLADDHAVVRYGIAQLINQQSDLVVCGEQEDAASALSAIGKRVNRPHASLDNSRIIEGLARFREEFAGEIRLEIMLVKIWANGLVVLVAAALSLLLIAQQLPRGRGGIEQWSGVELLQAPLAEPTRIELLVDYLLGASPAAQRERLLSLCGRGVHAVVPEHAGHFCRLMNKPPQT